MIVPDRATATSTYTRRLSTILRAEPAASSLPLTITSRRITALTRTRSGFSSPKPSTEKTSWTARVQAVRHESLLSWHRRRRDAHQIRRLPDIRSRRSLRSCHNQSAQRPRRAAPYSMELRQVAGRPSPIPARTSGPRPPTSSSTSCST